MKFNELNDKLQVAVKFIAAILFLTPLLITCVKNSMPYVKFVITGPILVENVDELKKSVFVLTGVVASDLKDIDDNEYYITIDGDKLLGRIKTTESGNNYIFIPSNDVGERTFIVNYNKDKERWYYVDFDGNYTEIYAK